MNRVIEVAKSYVGYLEKKTNAFLDDKTKNAGSNNYTKFGRDRGCNGQPWCDAFVDSCFIEAYGSSIAKKLLGGFSNYTPTSAQYFKNMKRWFTSPKTGDIIFFKNDVRICHTGIVYNVDNSFIYTIEGNTSEGQSVIPNGGSVCLKRYSKSNSRIAGYGRPDYCMLNTKTNQKVGVNSYFSRCSSSYVSIVDALKSIKADSSKDYRTKIAAVNGIKNYKGSKEQNDKMLKLLKEGKLIIP